MNVAHQFNKVITNTRVTIAGRRIPSPLLQHDGARRWFITQDSKSTLFSWMFSLPMLPPRKRRKSVSSQVRMHVPSNRMRTPRPTVHVVDIAA